MDKEAVDELNAEMEEYWIKKDEHRRSDAIQAGKKRSIKDRLGERRPKASKEDSNDAFETMSIPPPGKFIFLIFYPL